MESTADRFYIGSPAPEGALAPWARLLEGAGRFILYVVARHAQARRTRRTLYELKSLSPRQLADIGLTRADVDLMTAAAPGAIQAQSERASFF